MSSVKLNSKNVMDPLVSRLNINLSKYASKTKLSLKEVQTLEKQIEDLEKFSGYKPLYNLYKKRSAEINKLLQKKFYDHYKTPAVFYDFTYYKANNREINENNNVSRNLTNTNVSKKQHNFGDFVNFSNYRLTQLYYVDETHKLKKSNGEYYMAVKESYINYVNNIEAKLANLWDEIKDESLEIDEICIRYNDKCLIREFKGRFPHNFKIKFTPSIDDVNHQFALIISNGRYTLPEIPVSLTNGQIKLKNPHMTISKVKVMFTRLAKIKKQQPKFVYLRFKKNATVPKSKYINVLKPNIVNFLNKNPQYFVQYSQKGSSHEKPGMTMNYIGVTPNELNNIKPLLQYVEKNGNNYKYYKPNNVFGFFWPNYLTTPWS